MCKIVHHAWVTQSLVIDPALTYVMVIACQHFVIVGRPTYCSVWASELIILYILFAIVAGPQIIIERSTYLYWRHLGSKGQQYGVSNAIQNATFKRCFSNALRLMPHAIRLMPHIACMWYGASTIVKISITDAKCYLALNCMHTCMHARPYYNTSHVN